MKTSKESLFIEAIARCKGYSIQETTAALSQLPQDERANLRTHKAVKLIISVIKGEHAQQWLNEQHYNQTNSSSHRFNSRKEADQSRLDAIVANQLVEWMRWTPQATMDALIHIDEQDKPRLISVEAKVLLSRYSQKSGMDINPDKCSSRDIADLLDEVINHLTPM